MRKLALILLFLPSMALAGTGLRASVQRNQVTVDEPILLTLTVEGGRSGDPELGELPDFDVRSRGRSTSVQFVNGSISSQTSYTFELHAKAPGSYTIPAAQVVIGGQPYRSQPINVRVVAAGARPSNEDRSVYVTAEVSKNDPYVGEEVIYTFRLYRRVQVRNADLQLPSFDGFTVEDLGKNEYTTTVSGVQYVVTELRRALYPQEAGSRQLGGSSLTADVAVQKRRRGADPLDDFFGGPIGDPFEMFDRGPAERRVLKSDVIPLNVKALPPAPPGFSGLVGAFSIEAQLSTDAMKVGDSATLTVTVSGSGNARSMPDVHPTLPNAFKVYDDKPDLQVQAQPDGVSGKKVMKKALVATAPGEHTLPPMNLVYFEPESKSYKTSSTAPLTVRVAAGDGPEKLNLTQGTLVAPAKQAVAHASDELLPLRAQSGGFFSSARPGRRAALASLFFPPLLLGGFVAWQTRRERRSRDPRAQRRRGALARFLDSLRRGDGRSVAVSSRALRDFLGDLLDRQGGALTANEAGAALIERGADKDLVARTQALMNALEAAQYGGGGQGVRPEDVETLARELERAI